MCQSQQESLSMRRPAKLPRLEELIYDDVPQREIPAGAVGANYLSGILGLLSIAVAMLQGAHLSNLRKYERKFIKLATQKCEAGIRNPHSEELAAADRQLWSQMADLVNLHGWSLDDALTEFTEVRGDMASLLQARVALPKRLENTTAPRRPLGAKLLRARPRAVARAVLHLHRHSRAQGAPSGSRSLRTRARQGCYAGIIHRPRAVPFRTASLSTFALFHGRMVARVWASILLISTRRRLTDSRIFQMLRRVVLSWITGWVKPLPWSLTGRHA